MALIGKILSNIVRKRRINEPESKVVIYKADNIYATRFNSCNEDSKPLPGDFCLLDSLMKIGRKVILGFFDPKNESSISDGEKKIYSRNSSGGIVAFIYLKSNGSIDISLNGNVFQFDVEGNLFCPGNLIVSGEITASDAVLNGIRFTTHRHSGVDTGSGDSGPPVP